jgi:glycosyltransferase involved in cell wall biosynthesis
MNNTKPRVTIGLPVYNAEKYLEEALDSILTQSYRGFEVIISDNSSTDRTEEICKSYAQDDVRIRYFRNEQNIGAAPNFNQVFKRSGSEYFKWAAHDDLLAPDFLSACVKVLDENQEVVLCYPRAKIIDENSNYVVDYDPGPDTSSPNPHERFRNLILRPEYAIQQMGLIRAEILRRTELHGSYPSSDEVLLAQLALHGNFYEVPERLFLYRIYPQQSTQLMKTQRERLPFYDTSLYGKIVLPKWLYFFACLRVIADAPIRVDKKVYCYLVMARWLLKPAHIRAMGKDILLAESKLIKDIFSRNKAEAHQYI